MPLAAASSHPSVVTRLIVLGRAAHLVAPPRPHGRLRGQRATASGGGNAPAGMAPSEALRVQDQAVAMARLLAGALTAAATTASGGMQARFQSQMRRSLQYESPDLQAAARAAMPTTMLQASATEAAALSAQLGEQPPRAVEDALAVALLGWFKAEFFSWVDAPPCDFCGSQTVALNTVGQAQVRAEEAADGAARVELYRCLACPGQTRFPRYNNPGRLLTTRRGRCGEWANCFTLCCRALGLRARIVFDWTDHVWTEYYSHAAGRWIHMDPCEAAYDKPLLYTAGWGKKLSYVVAFSAEGAVDVTRRYVNDWTDTLTRRTAAPEAAVAACLAAMNAAARRGMPTEEAQALWERDAAEAAELSREAQPGALTDLPGRQTGSLEWRQQRGETGAAADDAKPAPAALGTRYVMAKDEAVSAQQPRRITGGAVRASGEHMPLESAVRAFDRRLDTKWLDFGGGGPSGSCWIEYRLLKSATPATVSEYAITSGNDEPSRDPAAFRLLGCPAEEEPRTLPVEEWLELDRREGVAFQARNQRQSFPVQAASQVPCVAWRLSVSATAQPHAATCCQLAALDLLKRE
eukprot:jgi/Tetstr1/461197/TSEL_006334.t1